MAESRPAVAVIIPTALHASRAATLEAAVTSVLTQDDVEVRPLLVVNGPGYSTELMKRWRADNRVRTFYLEEGNLPAAIRFGRMQVIEPYFCFLDDDDLYEPHTLRERIAAFEAGPQGSPDVVVTNGWRESANGVSKCYGDLQKFAHDPLRSLLEQNWLASCGGTFRSATVGPEHFDGVTRYLEWTTTAFRCASKLTVRFIDIAAYRIRESEQSLSKSESYRRGVVDGLGAIAALALPPDVHDAVLRKRCHALHDLSEYYRSNDTLRAAWRMHFVSVNARGGWRYLPYTARLVISAVERIFRTSRTSPSSQHKRARPND